VIPDEVLNGRSVCSNCTKQIWDMHTGGADECICEECWEEDGGSEAHGYDFFALVTIKDTKSCKLSTGLGSSTIEAYSSTCVRDQCDRPLFGALNLCRESLSVDPADAWRQISILIHEFVHMLGFSSALFRYFRNADGTPRLDRDPTDESKVMGEVPWSCSSAEEWRYPDDRGNRVHVDLVAQGMVGDYNERGINNCLCPLGGSNITMGSNCLVPVLGFRPPSCVLKLQTPKVVEEVQKHFGCPSLDGAELENQGFAKCTIFGSHWEQRIFMGELMASRVVKTKTSGWDVSISRVTLALFEDSGWYIPDYNLADYMIKGVNWGYLQGCAFAQQRCVNDGTTAFPRHWCTSPDARACSLDRKSEALCSLSVFATVPATVSYLQEDTLTGSMPETDYCPFHQITDSTHICTSSTSLPMPTRHVNYMREIFGPSSRCLDSTLHGDVGAQGGSQYIADPALFASTRPGCF
jgi:leishmanolysin-like peptidase